LQDREPALAAHLVVAAAKLGGEAEIAEIEAGELDPIDCNDAIGRPYAVLGKGGISGRSAAEPAREDCNRRQTQEVSRRNHRPRP
jgi:hypothetical protein